MMIERTVRLFDKPGPGNTDSVLEAVCGYVHNSDTIAGVIIGSISGRTALKLRDRLTEAGIPIVCVTGAPCWSEYPKLKMPLISDITRKQLEALGVRIVDSVPSSLSDTIEFSYARYGFRSPTWMFVETLLAVGGYGFKTAVECVLMATDGGYVPPFKEVLSIAGTDKGADTAIVARSTYSSTVFSRDPDKRFVIAEILAMPRHKVFYPAVTMGEWTVEEARRQKV